MVFQIPCLGGGGYVQLKGVVFQVPCPGGCTIPRDLSHDACGATAVASGNMNLKLRPGVEWNVLNRKKHP